MIINAVLSGYEIAIHYSVVMFGVLELPNQQFLPQVYREPIFCYGLQR